MAKQLKKITLPRWGKLVSIYLTSLIVIVVSLFGFLSIANANQIYPRVSVAGVSVGGLSVEQAKIRLEQELAKQPIKPVILQIDEQSFTISPTEVTASYDIDASAEGAYRVGRAGDWLSSLSQKVTTPLFGYDLPAKVKVDEAKFKPAIELIAKKINSPAKDTGLSFAGGQVTVTPSQVGQVVEIAEITKQVLDQLGTNQGETVKLTRKQIEPTIVEADVSAAKAQAELVLSQPISLVAPQQTFTASPATIGSWLATRPVKTVLKTNLELYFDEDKIGNYLKTIAESIDRPAKNARLTIAGGNLQIIESSSEGQGLDQPQAKADLVKILTLRKESPAGSIGPTSVDSPPSTQTLAASQVTLKVDTKNPDVTNENVASLGIKERIAVATTDFKTSPANRQENIKLGTKLFNGIILKPGEQFSAVKSLGRIDEASGFKPELVIKQDQLTPEVGGGLCQVSTTLFRSVMNGGLQIDERRNHRFRVSYYETKPANPDPEDYVTLHGRTLVGMDATIYDPSPDFKFTNDTGAYILIQGHVDGTTLTFELFGTRDGRSTSIDGPYITSTTPAPSEILYIDDPTLPVGQTKIKEKPHGGAKTYFVYAVNKGGKTIHKETYASSYTPWQRKDYRGTGTAVSPSPSVDPNASPAPSPSPSVAGVATEAPTVPSPTPEIVPSASPSV